MLRRLIEEHARRTGSPVAERALADWRVERFVKVMPHDYRRALEQHRDQAVSTGGDGFLTAETEEAAA